MARISGVNIPTSKKINIALTYIFGIGNKVADSLYYCEQSMHLLDARAEVLLCILVINDLLLIE